MGAITAKCEPITAAHVALTFFTVKKLSIHFEGISMFKLIIISSLFYIACNAQAQAFRSEAYCQQLADIGANTFNAKQSGNTLNSVRGVIQSVLVSEPQKLQAADGVVLAIYGDGSIKSASQARNIVYSSCKR